MNILALRPLVVAIGLACSNWAMADVYVVVAKDNPVETLSKKQIVAIYTGKTKAFPNGDFAKPVDHHDESSTKAEFYKALTNRSVSQINSYWARLVFTGRYVPPLQLNTEPEIIKHVRQTPGAIAYVKEADPELVKIVYTVTD